ncbi:hypothetical protein [Microbacterium sp. CPCC 204701]|uniref:hypothetical protein n=1 Tax=Microbacterium sp. CPCC 204701 TaxID=2493084 RepID=UPI000FDBFB27|nr:hypothetical protein [Microbacterium sp. CPCC 204701]
MTSWDGIYRFKGACERVGLEAPASIGRAIELLDAAKSHAERQPTRLLELSDDEARDVVTDLAIRNHTDGDVPSRDRRGIRAGLDEFRGRLLGEVAADIVPRLDGMIEQLRPIFDEAAAPLVRAAGEYGFTYQTTSDDVIMLDDPGAVDAWRGVRGAIAVLAPFVRFRITVSEVFELSPTRDEQREAAEEDRRPILGDPSAVDYSVCFADGAGWSLDGTYYVEGRRDGHIDWLKLAGGGLRLNTPEEVASKLAERHALRIRRGAVATDPFEQDLVAQLTKMRDGR